MIPRGRASARRALARAAVLAAVLGASRPAAADPAAPELAETPPDRGRFGALWVTPLGSHGFQGAGLEGGYRWRWLSVLAREGFVRNDFAPAAGTSLARTQRVSFDLEADAEAQLAFGTLALGAGAGVVADDVETSTLGAAMWTTTSSSTTKVRPLVNLAFVGLFEIDVTAYLDEHPEVRLSLGVEFGRRPRR